METRLSADVTEGCSESFRLGAASRAGATDAAVEGSLPEQETRSALDVRCSQSQKLATLNRDLHEHET